jgi:hypothetical protein
MKIKPSEIEVDVCEECENRFVGVDGCTKWCPYCGHRHEGTTELMTGKEFEEAVNKSE